MKTIELGKGKLAIVDDWDYHYLNRWKWHAQPHTKSKTLFYAIRNQDQTTIRMHRLIMDAPKGVNVDHINGNPLDNRRSNLRLCNQSQNNMNANKRRGCSSKYKGVLRYGRSKMWRAMIQGQCLGLYETEEMAAMVFDTAALMIYGDWARINFK